MRPTRPRQPEGYLTKNHFNMDNQVFDVCGWRGDTDVTQAIEVYLTRIEN